MVSKKYRVIKERKEGFYTVWSAQRRVGFWPFFWGWYHIRHCNSLEEAMSVIKKRQARTQKANQGGSIS